MSEEKKRVRVSDEDFVKAILDAKQRGETTTVEVAKRLGVEPSSIYQRTLKLNSNFKEMGINTRLPQLKAPPKPSKPRATKTERLAALAALVQESTNEKEENKEAGGVA